MLENLLNGQFGKSAVIWHYLVICSGVVSFFVGTPF